MEPVYFNRNGITMWLPKGKQSIEGIIIGVIFYHSKSLCTEIFCYCLIWIFYLKPSSHKKTYYVFKKVNYRCIYYKKMRLSIIYFSQWVKKILFWEEQYVSKLDNILLQRHTKLKTKYRIGIRKRNLHGNKFNKRLKNI